MTWEDGSPTVGRVFSSRLEDELGPARMAGRGALEPAHRRGRGASGAARGARAARHRRARDGERLAQSLPRRRGGAERGCERADPAGDGVRRALGAARCRRLGNRGRRRLPRLARDARAAAHLLDAPRLHRARVRRRGDRDRARGGRPRRRAARRRRALRPRRRAARCGRRRRLVPGPDGAGAARARQPLDPCRPAERRDEGRAERAGEASRAVPALRALAPVRGGGGLVRPGLSLALHGARLLRAARQARARTGDHSRRRHRPAPDGRRGGEPPVPPAPA